jgi:outer membrane protein TolC
VTGEDGTASTMDELKVSMDSNNAQLAKARQTYIQSLLDVKNAKANYQPTINLLLTSTYMPNPPIGKTTISVDELSSQLGVVIPGAAAGEYVTLYDGMKNIYYNAGLSITQPLFTWGKIPNAVRLYTQIAEIRALAIEDTSNQLTAQLKARVSALKYMDDILVLLDQTKDTADELVQVSQDTYDNGMILKQDVSKAKISAMEIDVTRQEIMKEYRTNLQELRTLTGNEDLQANDIDYSVNEEEIQAIVAIDHDELYAMATRASSEPLTMLRKQTQALQLKKKITQDSLYWKPDLALQVSLSYGGAAFPLVETNWYRADDYGLYLTLAVKSTVWDGGKKLNDVSYAQSEILGSIADYDAAVDQLQSVAEENIAAAELAQAKIEYLELKLEESQDRLQLLERKKEAGYISKVDVLSQQIEVYTNQMNLIKEKISLAQAAYTLAYVTGILE